MFCTFTDSSHGFYIVYDLFTTIDSVCLTDNVVDDDHNDNDDDDDIGILFVTKLGLKRVQMVNDLNTRLC